MKPGFTLYSTLIYMGVTQELIISLILFISQRGNRIAKMFLGFLILGMTLAISNGLL